MGPRNDRLGSRPPLRLEPSSATGAARPPSGGANRRDQPGTRATAERKEERRKGGERRRRKREEHEDAGGAAYAPVRRRHRRRQGNDSQQRRTHAGEIGHRRVQLGQPDRRSAPGHAPDSARAPSPSPPSASSGAGSQRRYAHEENSAPSRARHCDNPTTLRPPANTSPGPRPAKHTRSPRSPGTERPRWTSKPCCPSAGQRLRSTTPRPIRRRRTRRAPTAGRPGGSRRRATAGRPAARDTRPRLPRAGGPAPPPAPAWRRRRRPRSAGCCRAPASAVHLTDDGQSLRLGSELLDVEDGTGKPATLRTPQRDTAPTTGSTSDRWRSRQRCPSGGAGFTLIVQPSSESKLVGLDQVVALAGGHDVRPVVGAAPAARDHVVDGVGGLGAVHAEPAVAPEHGAPGHRRGAGPAWDAHHVGEPDDGRDVDREPRRVEDRAVLADGDGLGPARQHENDGTAIRDEGQRLVGRIEEEHPLHTPERLSAAGP